MPVSHSKYIITSQCSFSPDSHPIQETMSKKVKDVTNEWGFTNPQIAKGHAEEKEEIYKVSKGKGSQKEGLPTLRWRTVC